MSDNTKKIGAKIVLEGEKEFNQSLRNSKTALKELDSELKLTSAQFKDQEKSLEALQKVQQTYAKQQEALQKQEKTYVDQIEKASKAHKEAKSIHETTAKSIEELKKQLQEAEKQYGENSDEVEKLNNELKKSETQYKKEESAIADLENKMSRWQTGLNETRIELANTEDELEKVTDNIENYGKAIDDAGESTEKANPQLNELSVSMGKLVSADLIADGIRRLASAVVDLAKSSIEVGMEFEASMSKVEALSGATGADLDALTEKAREMGATTMYSASEAADALGYMALAGWDTQQMLSGIGPVLNLAAAANMDLAEASDIVTDYITAFGLSAQDASKFADQMAYAMANSNTDVTQLGEAYKNCAAAAASMNYSVEDVTAALMTMANAGVKGGEAGTALRAIMINLATNTKGCADELEKFGVHIYDSEGNMKGLSDILISTAGAFEGLSDAESNSLSKTIAGKTQYTGFQTIMLGLGDAAKEAGMSFEDYAQALDNCDGYAKEMADTMQNNLKGKLTILQSTMEALGESIYNVFDDDLKNGVDGATDAIARLNLSVKSGDLGASLNKMSEALGKLIDKTVDWLEDNLPQIVDGFTGIVENADKILPMIEGIVAGLIAFKTATTAVTLVTAAMKAYEIATQAATVAQEGMNIAANSNPYILLASVLAGVGVAIYKLVENADFASASLSELDRETKDIVENNQRFIDSLNDSAEARKTNREEMEAETSIAQDLVGKLKTMQSEYQKGADNMVAMKMVVAQLNEIMPDLNLTIDEQTGVLNMSTDAIEANVDALMRQAKVAAAQDDLAEIAKEQYEAEKKLKDLQEQRIAVQDEYTEASKKSADAQKEYTEGLAAGEIVIEESTSQLDYLRNNAINSKAALDDVDAQIAETQNEIESLGQEYAETTGYIEENTVAAEKSAETFREIEDAAKSTAGEIYTMSEEFQKHAAELQESVNKTLESGNSIFTKTKENEQQNIKDMQKNVQDHIDDINGWKNSYTELSQRVGDESGVVLQYLANMGTEGKGYIEEMLKLDDSQLTEFVNQMKEALTLPDTVSEEIVNSYTESVKNAIDGTTKTAQEAAASNSELRQAEKDVAEALHEELEDSWGADGEKVTEHAEEAMDGVETAINDAVPEVKAAAEEVARNVEEPIKETASYRYFYDMGVNVGKGMEEGIRSKISGVRQAAQELANAAKNGAKVTLQINSPSKVFKSIGDSIGEGLEMGIEDSMKGVINTLNNTLPNENNIEVSSFQNVALEANDAGNSTLSKIDNLLTQYLPVLSKMQVVLDTGAAVGALAPGINNEMGKINTRRT